MKMSGVLVVPLGIRICQLVPLRVLYYKMTAGKVIVVSFKVLSKNDRNYDCPLIYICNFSLLSNIFSTYV